MHEYGNLPFVGRVIKALLIVLPSTVALAALSFLTVAVLRTFRIRYQVLRGRSYLLLGSIIVAATIATANVFGSGDVNTLHGFLVLSLVMPTILTTTYARSSFLRVVTVCIVSVAISLFLSAKVVFFMEDYWTYGGYPSVLANLIVGRSP